MKKLLVLIAVSVFLFSCQESNIKKRNDLPIEVMKLASSNQFDTVIVVNTSEYYHVFENGGYKESVSKERTDPGAMIVLGMFIGGILSILLFSYFKK